jgi:hypothetical protein
METAATPEVLLAHPVAVLAVPAFVPVVGIVVTVLWVARKDRLAAAAEDSEGEEVTPGATVPEPRRTWRDRLPRLVVGDAD